jgi:hypothetical protein
VSWLALRKAFQPLQQAQEVGWTGFVIGSQPRLLLCIGVRVELAQQHGGVQRADVQQAEPVVGIKF